MNKVLVIILAFIFVNGFFSLTSFLFPTISIDKTLPIQFWINALLLFAVFLPGNVASFLPTL